LKELFQPKSVAIFGATNKKGKIGFSLVENLSEYNGELYYNTTPHSVAYCYFSCICSPESTTDHRFDPFFAEIANLATLTDADPKIVGNQSFGAENLTYGFHIKNSKEDLNQNQIIRTSNWKDIIQRTNQKGNVDKLTTDGLGVYHYGHHRNGSYQEGYYILNPNKQDNYNNRMDYYLSNYTPSNTRLDYDDTLFASEIIYIPEHDYHLVKIENTWLPIRGWNTSTTWGIKEIPTVHYPQIFDDDTQGNTGSEKYPTDSTTLANKTSLFTTLRLDQNLISYKNNDPYFTCEQNNSINLTLASGFVSDCDGQMVFGNPQILHGKLNWFNNIKIYQNLSDTNIALQSNIEYIEDNDLQYISVGYWNDNTPSNYKTGVRNVTPPDLTASNLDLTNFVTISQNNFLGSI
jgi:hypothetical protein